MIRYALICDAGHGFDSWFRESAAFEQQIEAGLLGCPVCGSRQISKQIMAPAVTIKDVKTPLQHAASQPVALLTEQERAMRAMLKAFHAHLESHAENVGAAFADEARKIHSGESAERAIYGAASVEDARDLIEEGIDVVPVPILPEDRH